MSTYGFDLVERQQKFANIGHEYHPKQVKSMYICQSAETAQRVATYNGFSFKYTLSKSLPVKQQIILRNS